MHLIIDAMYDEKWNKFNIGIQKQEWLKMAEEVYEQKQLFIKRSRDIEQCQVGGRRKGNYPALLKSIITYWYL
ncbi:MAG: hypothetical protein Q8942_05920 [Bacillota bacterium]|nr:hypothetical protein [Bacillota bacterium]